MSQSATMYTCEYGLRDMCGCLPVHSAAFRQPRITERQEHGMNKWLRRFGIAFAAFMAFVALLAYFWVILPLWGIPFNGQRHGRVPDNRFLPCGLLETPGLARRDSGNSVSSSALATSWQDRVVKSFLTPKKGYCSVSLRICKTDTRSLGAAPFSWHPARADSGTGKTLTVFANRFIIKLSYSSIRGLFQSAPREAKKGCCNAKNTWFYVD